MNSIYIFAQTFHLYQTCRPPSSIYPSGAVNSWRRTAEHLTEKAGQRLRISAGRITDELCFRIMTRKKQKGECSIIAFSEVFLQDLFHSLTSFQTRHLLQYLLPFFLNRHTKNCPLQVASSPHFAACYKVPQADMAVQLSPVACAVCSAWFPAFTNCRISCTPAFDRPITSSHPVSLNEGLNGVLFGSSV